MIDIDEMRQRVLSELEEFGEEDVASLANKAADGEGDEGELQCFREALERLIADDLVLMAPEHQLGKALVELDKEQSLQLLAETLKLFRFDKSDLLWMIDPHVYNYVVVTETGMAAAVKILRERGYEWWLHEG
jgi:hypothetical protein